MPVGKIRMRLEIEGQTVFDRRLNGMIDRLGDLGPFWDQVVTLWSDYQTRMFDAEGAVDGAPQWRALSTGYAAWKERHFPGAPILQRTGAMRQHQRRDRRPAESRTLGHEWPLPVALEPRPSGRRGAAGGHAFPGR